MDWNKKLLILLYTLQIQTCLLLLQYEEDRRKDRRRERRRRREIERNRQIDRMRLMSNRSAYLQNSLENSTTEELQNTCINFKKTAKMPRKTPFSGKKKKDQLLQKRQMKNVGRFKKGSDDEVASDDMLTERALNQQPLKNTRTSAAGRNVNRYNLKFYQESKTELERIKQEGLEKLGTVSPKSREIDDCYFKDFDFPVRPPWNHSMSKDALERNEQHYFRNYVEALQKKQSEQLEYLSLFELNLETWRQLWRVLELSDILLIIVDVRNSTLMFPPAVYDYIINKLKKRAILVLNKVDLVQPDVVVAWRHYFREKYADLPVVLFASYPAKIKQAAVKRSRNFGHKRCMEGVHNIYKECKNIVSSEVDLSGWEQKILEDMSAEDVAFLQDDESCIVQNVKITEKEDHPYSGDKYRDGILTVGCIGFPNVGKSSLINALKGRKVVSVSRTPGHTKHFQTIFLTNNVRLCDCPGLVFPSSTPKYLQVLFGSFPISQLQVPYRSLKFLAEHLDMPKLLKLHLPEDYDEWSAVGLADAWALKRGFLTAKAARPDRYRAANHLLRMCLAGQCDIILQFYPPGYHENKVKWATHAEVAEVRKYQNQEDEEKLDEDDEIASSSHYEESDDTEDSCADGDADSDTESDVAPKTKIKAQAKNTFALLDDD